MNPLMKPVVFVKPPRATDLVDGHVPPDAAGGGEHHAALPALEHPAPLVAPQVVVQTAAGNELLAALVADKRALARVAPRVLLQVTALLESGGAVGAVVLALEELALAWVVDGAEPGRVLEEALVGDDQGLLQAVLGGLLLPPRLGTAVCSLPVLAQTAGVQKFLTTVRAVEWLVVLLDVGPE